MAKVKRFTEKDLKKIAILQKFETDDLTKKIISKYFGINIKKEDK